MRRVYDGWLNMLWMGIVCYCEIVKNFLVNLINIILMCDMVVLYEIFVFIKVIVLNFIMLYSICKFCIDLGGYFLINDRVSKVFYCDLLIMKKDYDRKIIKYVVYVYIWFGKLMIMWVYFKFKEFYNF